MDSVTTRAKPPAGWFERRRQLVALLGAGVLHGAAWLASVALSPPEAARVVEQRAVAADEVAIELELLEQPQTGTHQESAAAPAPVIQRLAKASRFSGAAARRVDDPVTGEPKEGNGPAWEASAAKPETDEHDPKAPRRRLSLTDLGVGNSRAHWRIPSGEPGAPSTRAARQRLRKQQLEARIEKEMAQKALERDVERGIGPGGPVLSALEGVARTSSAPVRGYAVFQITTNAAGNITGVRLLDSNGGTPQWGAVGKEVQRRLAGQRLRVAGKPTRLLVRIESTESLPSGADPGLAIDAFGIPIKRGEGKKSAKLSLFTPPQFVEVEVPNAGDPRQKIKLPMFVPPSIIGGGGDLADVGSKRRRMVHSRILRAETLAAPRKDAARKGEGRQDLPAAPRED